MKKITITQLKKYLKSKNNNELVDEIIELFKKFNKVQQYYSINVNPNSEKDILKKYKKIIKEEFFPTRELQPKMRYSVINKTISDFQKLSKDINNLIDLKLSYVEIGVEFTNDYGDIDDQFYRAIERTYEESLEIIYQNKKLNSFKDRCRKIMEDSQGHGWGFSDYMRDVYNGFYLAKI